MPDAIVYADAEGVIRLWNRGAARIFGLTEAEALGRSLEHYHSGAPARAALARIPRYDAHWADAFTETARCCPSRLYEKDGARISVEFTIVPFTNDAGQMIGIAAIMRDATARFEERRALRRQLAADAAANSDVAAVVTAPPE